MANNRVHSPAELDEVLPQLDGWTLDNDRLMKQFTFGDFRQAFAFMSEVAILAEQQQHHPDWQNSYNRVLIYLRTHELDGISGRDIALAQAINDLEQ